MLECCRSRARANFTASLGFRGHSGPLHFKPRRFKRFKRQSQVLQGNKNQVEECLVTSSIVVAKAVIVLTAFLRLHRQKHWHILRASLSNAKLRKNLSFTGLWHLLTRLTFAAFFKGANQGK